MISIEEWNQIVTTGGDEEIMMNFDYLPDEDIISVIQYADGEICNGGFFQYYSNGIFDAKQHCEYLLLVGLPSLAQIVQQSLEVFPGGLQPKRSPQDVNPIDKQVLALVGSKSRFDDLDSAYYADCELIFGACANWVRQNPDHYWQVINGEL